MCEAGFIKIIQMSVSNLAVRNVLIILPPKKISTCKGEEEKAQLLCAEAGIGV